MKILIIGAGISGLAMAIALDRLHIKYRIIDKSEGLRFEGAGIALPANAIACLSYLGLEEEITQIAYAVKSITYSLSSGEVLNSSLLSTNFPKHFSFVAIHRKELISLLANKIKTKIEFNKELIKFENKNSTSTVLFNDREICNFDLIISADGINSKLRFMVNPVDTREDLGIATWRFIAKFKQAEPIYYFGKKSVFMIYPISQDEVYCYAHIVDTNKSTSKNYLSYVFTDYPTQVNWLIQSTMPEDIIFGRLISISKPIFRSTNIAFIGDSSHACSPMLQQGAASAFEDAITLSRLLAEFKNIEQILRHYEEIRKPRIEWIKENSDTAIKNISISTTDKDFEQRNNFIKKNGPTNVMKWKKLFSINYLESLNNYINDQHVESKY